MDKYKFFIIHSIFIGYLMTISFIMTQNKWNLDGEILYKPILYAPYSFGIGFLSITLLLFFSEMFIFDELEKKDSLLNWITTWGKEAEDR